MKLKLIDKYPCEKGTSFDDYISILCKHKVLDGDDISWQDIADLASHWFPVGYSRHFYSRHAEEFLSLSREEGKSEDDELTQEEIEDPTDILKEQLLEMQKERAKIQDERSQNRAYVRRLAREDTIKEIAHSNKNNKNVFLSPFSLLASFRPEKLLSMREIERIHSMIEINNGNKYGDNFHSTLKP